MLCRTKGWFSEKKKNELWESAGGLSTPFIATVGNQVSSHNTAIEFVSECGGVCVQPAVTFVRH